MLQTITKYIRLSVRRIIGRRLVTPETVLLGQGGQMSTHGNIGTGRSAADVELPSGSKSPHPEPQGATVGNDEANTSSSDTDTNEETATDFEPVEADLNTEDIGTSKIAAQCPYCGSKDFVRRGTRKKKYEVVQLYLCRNEQCSKTFTAQSVKGKRYPLNVILEGLSYYNLGLTREATCSVLKQKYGVEPEPATLSAWLEEYKELCRYARLRPFATKMYSPRDVVEVCTLAHRQLYRFRYHRAKMCLLLDEFKHSRFFPLKEYLDNVSSETPHQYFQDGMRMSEIKTKFDKADMIVRSKTNYANQLAGLVLQSVVENKDRHEAVQRFMLANDSVSVATEVPVYIRAEDIEHMENTLQFKILDGEPITVKNRKSKPNKGAVTSTGLPRLLTGHIDLVQVRNRQIHIMDFKPNAAKEKPIEQLTWYALALSRLTGLRLFEFKCAWFDEKDYFEFYPLHVVKKLRPVKKKRKVHYRSGDTVEIPKTNELVIA